MSLSSLFFIKQIKRQYNYDNTTVGFKKSLMKYMTMSIIIIEIYEFYKEIKETNEETPTETEGLSYKEVFIVYVTHNLFHKAVCIALSCFKAFSVFLAGYLLYYDIIIKKFILEQMEKETIENLQGESVYLLRVVKNHINPIVHCIVYMYNGVIGVILIYRGFFKEHHSFTLLVFLDVLYIFTAVWVYFINVKSDKKMKNEKTKKNLLRQNLNSSLPSYSLKKITSNGNYMLNNDEYLFLKRESA